MPRSKTPRKIAIVGIMLESNRSAPVTRAEDFSDNMMLRGADVLSFIEPYDLADAAGNDFDWTPQPVLVAAAGSGGPLEHSDYLDMWCEIEERLRAIGTVDGVLVLGHGAGLTTESDDLDGDYLARLRAIVGAGVPIVVELDLHANLSDAMVDATNAIVGYRTNPHIDQRERARDCMRLLRRLVEGEHIHVAFERLPLVTAQIAQLTKAGTPYGRAIGRAEAFLSVDSDVATISLLSGFSFSDTSYNGFSVYVGSWKGADHARTVCNELAQQIWESRYEFEANALTIKQAVGVEIKAARGNAPKPRIYADIADNPGGGGRGNTVHLLRSFYEAGLQHIMAAAFYDPALVREAQSAGLANGFSARLNSEEATPSSGRWTVEARVENLFDGKFVADRGVLTGRKRDFGRCATLSIGDGRLKMIVCSLRHQVLCPQIFELGALDVQAAQALILKSRGHFRAGFTHVTLDDHIYEVDGPGLTTANIAGWDWSALPRPVFPIDRDVQYRPVPDRTSS